MKEDLSGAYPGYGYGALDSFNGYIAYRALDERALASEINEMRDLIARDYEQLHIDQDLGLGMMLWLTHFFPQERWATIQSGRCLPRSSACGLIRPVISAVRPVYGTSNSRSPTMASRLGCRQLDVIMIESFDSTSRKMRIG
jgi:hypothetical protein